MESNTKKCSVMEFGMSKRRHKDVYLMGRENINKKKEEKNLRVTIMENKSPEKHINKITGEIYNLLKNIRVAFTYVDEDMIKKLITTSVRPRSATVWSPSIKIKTIKKLERIQIASTKRPLNLRELSYKERLQMLGLTTLEQRR